MDAEKGALSLDSAVELLRAPPEEAPEATPDAEPVEAVEEIDEAPPAEEAVEGGEETETEAQDASDDDEQVTDEVNEETDEPAIPAVDPPAFWTAAEKAEFAKWPAEVQQSVARNFKASEAHVNRIQQEIAAERKAAAERQAALEQELTTYQEQLLATVPQPPDPALIDEDPVEYLRQDSQYKQALFQAQQAWESRQKAEAEKQAAREREQQEEQARHAEYMRAETEKLRQLIPELAKPETAPKVISEIKSYANRVGFDDEVLSMASASELHILHKAMKWDRAQEAAKAAKAKPVPKVAAPGVGRSKAELSADQRKSALARLERTGSIDDAVRALRM